MSDTQLFEIDEENDSQVAQWYKRLFNQTAVIDEKLDAGSEAATRRAFTGKLVDDWKGGWSPAATSVNKQLADLTEAGNMEEMVGNYLGLIRNIQSAFSKQVEDWVKSQVEALPQPEENKLSDDEKKALGTERTELAKQIKTIVEMAKTFGEPGADSWKLPPQRRAFGKRGERALYTYNWSIDGQELEGDDNDPKGVAEKLGYTKVSEFTADLKTAGINTTKPEPEFTVEIKGHQVTAAKTAVDSEEEEGEEATEEAAE